MKSKVVLAATCMMVSALASPSSTTEGLAYGFKKYYANGYIGIKCDQAQPSHCVVSVLMSGRFVRGKLDLERYGYRQASEPIAAYLAGPFATADSVSFYFHSNCTEEDSKVSNRAIDDIQCLIRGELTQGKVNLESVEITSIFVEPKPFLFTRTLRPSR